MKRTLMIVGLVLLSSVVPWAQTAKPNFSGTWVLDLAKSDFGQMPAPQSMVAVIDHKEPNINVKTTQKSDMGEVVNERNLSTDGKNNTNKLRTMGGDQEVTSTSTWTGKKLVTTFKLDFQGTAIDVSDSWELSDDGKMMVLVRDYKRPQGTFTQKIAFNKQ